VSAKRTMLDMGGGPRWFKKSVFARTSLMDDPLPEKFDEGYEIIVNIKVPWITNLYVGPTS